MSRLAFELVLRSYFAYTRNPHNCAVKRLLCVACMLTLAGDVMLVVLRVPLMLKLTLRIIVQLSVFWCSFYALTLALRTDVLF